MRRESKKVALAALWDEKLLTLFVFSLIFVGTVGVLDMVGFLPENARVADESQRSSVHSDPSRIVIDAIGVDVQIENPNTRDISILDEALKKGVVHYPGSGKLGEDRNIFLFGHSSYLPVIHNKNYKVFNDLKKLETGDMIRVQGGGKEYLYRVDSVTLVDAEDARIDLSGTKAMLTLSTCNSFGAPGERYVVEAAFVGSYSLTS